MFKLIQKLTILITVSTLVLIVPKLSVSQEYCYPREELGAVAAITFIFSQGIKAGLCDNLFSVFPGYWVYETGGMYETHGKILEKFVAEFNNYFFIQRNQYQRFVGAEDDETHMAFLQAHSDFLTQWIAPGISIGDCTRFIVILDSRLAGGWQNIENVIKADANRYLPQLKRCGE